MRASRDRARWWERAKVLVVPALACALSTLVVSRASAQRSSKERRVDEPVPELVPRALSYPQVAFGADEYLVVWVDQRLDARGYPIDQLLGARVTPDGRVLDPRGFAIAVAGATHREPRVARSHDGFLVLWRETRSWSSEVSRFARVAADAHVLDPEGVALPPVGAQALSCAGADCVTVSSPLADLRVLGFDVCGGTRPDVTLAIPPQTSSQPSFNATAPHLTSGACGHFVAFGQRDQVSAEVSIALAGFELDGRKRFARVVQRLPPNAGVPPSVDLASDEHGEVLLIWQQAGDSATQPSAELWSMRLNQTGEALSGARRLMAGTNPALAFNGNAAVLVAGADVLSAVMLNDDGSVRTPEPTIIRGDPPGLRGPARVAAGPSGALVVWDPKSTPIENELNAARLDADGQLLDPNGLAVAAAANCQAGVQLASDGQGYLLLFHDDRPNRAGFLSIRLDAQGQPLADSAAVFESPLDVRAKPQLTRVGAAHALLWSEDQNQFLSWLDPDTHMARARIALPVGAANSARHDAVRARRWLDFGARATPRTAVRRRPSLRPHAIDPSLTRGCDDGRCDASDHLRSRWAMGSQYARCGVRRSWFRGGVQPGASRSVSARERHSCGGMSSPTAQSQANQASWSARPMAITMSR